MNNPSERILIIERSLRCFAMGWFSLVPPLGIILFPLALMEYSRGRILSSESWNPASRYLTWGFILAAFGGLLSSIALGFGAWWFLHDRT